MRTCYCILLFIFCAHAISYAQQGDTLKLREVIISAERPVLFRQGKNFINVDSSLRHISPNSSVAEILISSTPAFIKSYGPGSIATISARGTEARHNQVSWNGFTINSPTLGLTDLSIIPVSLADNILYIPGGSAPVNGNSALGSVILLNNSEPAFIKQKRILISYEGGSFGLHNGNISYFHAGKKIESSTSALYSSSKNNFSFINIAHRDKPEMKQTHAGTHTYGINQQLHYKINVNQVFSIAAWYQVNRREIPPLMTTPVTFSEQRDSNLRITAAYKATLNKSVITFRAALFREHQFYDDDKTTLHLRYDVKSYMGEGEWRYRLNEKITINSGVSLTESKADFREYARERVRSMQSIFSGILYKPFAAVALNFHIRKDFVNAEEPPVIPSIGLEADLTKFLVLKVNAGLHFNLPAMNELYWIPGGNENLLPEKAKSAEGGIVLFRDIKNLPELSLTAYYSTISNWIKWQPGPGGIFSPVNIMQVVSKGIESSLNYNITRDEWKVKVTLHYAFCNSSASKIADIYSQDMVNRQLVYIPEHMAGSIINFSSKGFSLILLHHYTGLRFTTADHSAYLEEFIVADVILEKLFMVKQQTFSAYVKINNIYNNSYQVLAYRPSPPRWLAAGIKINFNLPCKTS